MDEHPEVSTRLLVGDDRISINPKLNNLVKGWHAAAHDWIVMTDCNVLMPPDYLDRVLERWQPDTGLVCSPPVGTRPEGRRRRSRMRLPQHLSGALAAHRRCAGHRLRAGQDHVLAARRSSTRAGSIEALAAEPAEDAASTKLIRAAGRKVRLVIHPFPQPLGRRAIARRLAPPAALGAPAPLVLPRWSMRRKPSPAASSRCSARPCLSAMGALPIGWFIGLGVAWYGAEAAARPALRLAGVAAHPRPDDRARSAAVPAMGRGVDGKHVRLARQRHGHQGPRRRRCDGLSSAGRPLAWYVRPWRLRPAGAPWRIWSGAMARRRAVDGET